MKVLMFGWEFPPFKSGGLGTACYDLTKGLSRQGIKVTFVMPKAPEGAEAEFVNLLGTNNYLKNVKIRTVDSPLLAYNTSESYADYMRRYKILGTKGDVAYGEDLHSEVQRFSEIAKVIAEQEGHDVIHAHDWMAYRAGINAKKVSGKPLVCHIHATEFDRTGNNPNYHISHKEFEGLKEADLVIANSNYTKQNIINQYMIDPKKIKVVHWGIDPENPHYQGDYTSKMSDHDKIVLFLGRVTLQKGPDYFLQTAKKVLAYVPNTKFVVAGSGDMLAWMIEKSAEMEITNNMVFTGFLKGKEVHDAYKMADLFVMPSVSEPFGLTAIESIKNGTPVILSKNSGASEVLTNVLKVDFWDIDEMTNKIVGSLKYRNLYNELRDNSLVEADNFNLDVPAKKVIDAYNHAISYAGGVS
ncbi:glycosyltransferase family 4 protein [Candidatus Woesearchaeota archaeon]|nr:glycosyltransferase family 4 protein [Candidatus Woesearchaeota archaeon]